MHRMRNAFTSAHGWLYRRTNGRALGRIRKAPILLLTTRGRRSGEPRSVPLLYLEDGDDLVVIASAGGQATDPAWYLNLMADPSAEVQVGSAHRPVRARVATGDERTRLWDAVNELYASYDSYQQRTSREIPVVVLEPAG